MTLKALIFDFDGLILDTESPIYYAIRDVYQQYGFAFPLDEYTYCIGSYEDTGHFLHKLREKMQTPLNFEQLLTQINTTMLQNVNSSTALPGVVNLLEQAKTAGLECLVASSSSYDWVNSQLTRLGLRHFFTHVCTSDDVQHVKPEPDLFLLALSRANIQANEAIIFEDSANGILAAFRAGIFRIAVPNPMTQHLDFSKANMVLKRIDEVPVNELLTKVI
jgi:putative hydrolase of the HAD superfamily